MGRVFQPPYTVKGANGERIAKKSKHWHIEFTNEHGRTVRRKAGLTKEQARDALRKAESDVLSAKNGLPTRRAKDCLLSKLAESYLDEQARVVSVKHLYNLRQRLTATIEGTGAVFLKDLTPERVEEFLDEFAARDRSARTVNMYRQSVVQMLNWAVRRKIVPYNPLECVARLPEHEKRRERRALLRDESERLSVSAVEGPLRRIKKAYKGGKIPPEVIAELSDQGERNDLIYAVFQQTGLRVDELRRMARADFDLAEMSFRVRAEISKNRKEAILPLHPALAERLRDWMKRHPAPESAPALIVPKGFLRIFDDDIAAAGILKRDSAGRTLDLHALRHTFGTRLCEMGVDPKTIQILMRHSSPVLTLGVYLHSDRERMSRAVAKLPEIQPQPQTSPLTLARTGTDDTDNDSEGGGDFPCPPRIRQENEGKAYNLLVMQQDSKPCASFFQADYGGSIPPTRSKPLNRRKPYFLRGFRRFSFPEPFRFPSPRFGQTMPIFANRRLVSRLVSTPFFQAR
jgi:integrase